MPYPTVSESNAGVDYTVKDFEVDRIEVYEGDPYSGLNYLGAF
jgi:hypothetical protein